MVFDCSDKEYCHHFQQKIPLVSGGIGNDSVFFSLVQKSQIISETTDIQNLHIGPQPRDLRTLEGMVQRQTHGSPWVKLSILTDRQTDKNRVQLSDS